MNNYINGIKLMNIRNYQGQLIVDSREVAEMCDVRHDHLLRNIDKYVEILNTSKMGSSDFFIESSYKQTGNGKENKCYLLTRKGCDMVANKMTGEKGILFTAAYVTKFEEMERATKGNLSLAEFKGQMATLVQDMIQEQLVELKDYYKIKASTKHNISTYIKQRLGVAKACDEYESVKARIFLITGITKWEDLSIEDHKKLMPIIDESIRVIKLERPQQISLF